MQQIYGYQPRSEQDVLVAGWWKFLNDTHELHKLFPASQQSLSSFLTSFARPVELVFQLNDGGEICRAAWFSPSMQVGAEGGMWIHPDLRASKDSMAFVLRCLEVALDTWGVVFGITKQPALLDAHIQLGYTVSEELPNAWDGESAWIVMLTKAAFQEARHGRSKGPGKSVRERTSGREQAVDESNHTIHDQPHGPGHAIDAARSSGADVAVVEHADPERQVGILESETIDHGSDGPLQNGRHPIRTAHPRGPNYGRRISRRQRSPELLSVVLADRRQRSSGSGQYRDGGHEQRDGGRSEPDQHPNASPRSIPNGIAPGDDATDSDDQL